MNFGKYFIGQDFSEIVKSKTKIPATLRAASKRTFRDEIFYNANDTIFCNTAWKTVIGVIQGKVYKISLQTPETLLISPLTGNLLWHKVFRQLNDELLNFTNQQRVGNYYLTKWITAWGNVVLNRASLFNEIEASALQREIINITVTGRFAFNDEKKITSDLYMDVLL